MKRFFLLIVLVMVVSWFIASHRSPFRRAAGPSGHWAVERHVTKAMQAPPYRRRDAGGKPRHSSRRSERRGPSGSRRGRRRGPPSLRRGGATKSTRLLTRSAATLVRRLLNDRCSSFRRRPIRALPPVPPALPSASEKRRGTPGADRAGNPGDRGRGDTSRPPRCSTPSAIATVRVSTADLRESDRHRAALGHQGARRG